MPRRPPGPEYWRIVKRMGVPSACSAALAYAREALSAAELCHLRSQVHRYATLAVILAERGEAEESTTIATTMLDRARGMESRRVRDRVLTVSKAIQAQGDSMAAREFGERVSNQFSVPL
jgi:hypothetical protein